MRHAATKWDEVVQKQQVDRRDEAQGGHSCIRDHLLDLRADKMGHVRLMNVVQPIRSDHKAV